MTCTCTYNIPLQGLERRAPMVEAIARFPQPNWSPSLVPFHQSWIYMVSKKHSGKVNQSTLASKGSEHA